ASGARDQFTRSYAAGGAPRWTRQFGSSQADAAGAIGADDSGVYVAGVTNGARPDSNRSGLADMITIKFNATGDRIRAWRVNPRTSIAARAIELDGARVYALVETPL